MPKIEVYLTEEEKKLLYYTFQEKHANPKPEKRHFLQYLKRIFRLK
ncbi:MAG: hypothetical protein AB1420_12945 [Bacillota bacterium]